MAQNELRLDDKVVVITGAGRGIGRAHAQLLAERGAKVVVNDLGTAPDGSSSDATPADQAVKELQSAGLQATADHHDIADPHGAAALIETAIEAYGRIDGLVNNAGVFSGQSTIESTDLDQLNRSFRINLGGTFNTSKAVWPHFRKQGAGKIVNTSSLAGLLGAPTNLDYTASKGAVLALSLALAAEGAADNIQVNAILPGGMSRMIDGSMVEDYRPILEQCLRPELVSPAVLWLLHPETTATAGIYEAVLGRVGRIAVGTAPGIWDVDMSAEKIAASRDAIEGTEQIDFHGDFDAWNEWLITTSFGLHNQSA
ncbi:MAG: SDR family NAD(P)-dependent oxidoreductase [Aeromicrobium sp.]